MSHHKTDSNDAIYHLIASSGAAIVNFPLWRASAIAQSGFKLEGANVFAKYYRAITMPPFKGVFATMAGMSWARASIFYGSDVGKQALLNYGAHYSVAQTIPPLVISTIVQIVNQPLVRSTITIQDPSCDIPNVTQAMVHIYKTRGLSALWHGVSAGIFKTVPKYITAVAVKDYMEDALPLVDPYDKKAVLMRAAVKSVTAGVAGAVLTNPLDVLRNEMFKTDLSLVQSFKKVLKEEGWAFMGRGITSNTTAVAVPIAVTIFVTDLLITNKDKLKLV